MAPVSFFRLLEFINHHDQSVYFDHDTLSICFSGENIIQLSASINDELDVESYAFASHTAIPQDSFNFQFYWDIDDFRKRVKLNSLGSTDVAILHYSPSTNYYFDHKSKITYVNQNQINNDNFYHNYLKYWEFLSFLKDNEHKEDYNFHFVDYFSMDKSLFILTTAKKEGKLTVNFPEIHLYLDPKINYSDRFDRFFKAFDDTNKTLPKFIKSEFFAQLSTISKEDRFKILIEKLDIICEIAEQNFDIYLQDLSLDNFKKDYLASKDKYFSSLRDILNKIGNQAIGLPVTVTAILIAANNIGTNILSSLLLIFAVVVYNIFTVMVIQIQRSELMDLRGRFRSEFESLSKSDFFKKYSTQIQPFENIKEQVEARIKLINITLVFFLSLHLATQVLLILKLLFQIALPLFLILILLVLVLVILGSVYYYTDSKINVIRILF
jgi:hypothetical protein